MNLQQIEAVCEIVKRGFSISAAAQALDRPQPTVSRQIQDLEAELGVRIFFRTRNRVVGLTIDGKDVLRLGQRVMSDVKALRDVGSPTTEDPGELTIATTHLHARYSLPRIMKMFAAQFPTVSLTLRQGDPNECCQLVATGEADIGIATIGQKIADEIVTVPAFRLSRCVIAPLGHPLTGQQRLTLKKLAEYPIVSFSKPYRGHQIIDQAFERVGLRPRIVCSVIDADVSKTCVEAGMGISVLARIAYDQARDRNLVAIDAGHLFQPTVVNLVFRRYNRLHRHALEFVAMYAPHLSGELIVRAIDGISIDKEELSRTTPFAR